MIPNNLKELSTVPEPCTVYRYYDLVKKNFETRKEKLNHEK